MKSQLHPQEAPSGVVLVTARLILRPTSSEDFDAWADFSSHPETMRFLGGPQSRPIAWRAFVTMAGCWSLYGFGMFSMIHRATNRWIGRIGPWRPEGWPGNEVGWGIAHEFEGQGYAFEAAEAAINWAFATLGWDEVIHCIPAENVRSRALAQRLGSTYRGRTVLPPPAGTEVEVWGQRRKLRL